MPSPVAIVGLNWDGFDIQRADLDIFIEIAEGLDDLPDVRTSDQVVPFRSGRLASRGTADGRAIVGNGWIAGSGATPRTSYRAYLDELKAKLDPTGDPRILVATLENGSTRWIRAIPRGLLPGSSIGGEFREFSIEWKACEPYWYGSWGVLSLDGGLLLDDGHALDGSAELVVAPTSLAHLMAFNTLGSADVERVTVRLAGPSTAAVGAVTLLPDGSEAGFILSRALLADEELVVDNHARSALIGGMPVRNLMTLQAGNRHGEYIRLVPGMNSVRIVGQPAEARLQFVPTYL